MLDAIIVSFHLILLGVAVPHLGFTRLQVSQLVSFIFYTAHQSTWWTTVSCLLICCCCCCCLRALGLMLAIMARMCVRIGFTFLCSHFQIKCFNSVYCMDIISSRRCLGRAHFNMVHHRKAKSAASTCLKCIVLIYGFPARGSTVMVSCAHLKH